MITKSSKLLQNLLGHLQALSIPSTDHQELHLHLKRFKKEGVSIPHCLVGCLIPKGLIEITKVQVNIK